MRSLRYTLFKIQDTLKSTPPENETMKKANRTGIVTMTIVFILCSCSGYAAFGPLTPGSILMGSGFREPFWLIELANVFIVVHLIGAYQVRYLSTKVSLLSLNFNSSFNF